MSRRTERIGNLIRGIVSEAIQQRLSDPRIAPVTSITYVDVSADLSLARIHVSVLATPPRRELCITALQHAAGRLRGAVAEQVRMRQVPRLEFVLDDSLQRAFETVQVIDNAMVELGEPAPWERPPRPDPAADPAPPETAGPAPAETAAPKPPPAAQEDH